MKFFFKSGFLLFSFLIICQSGFSQYNINVLLAKANKDISANHFLEAVEKLDIVIRENPLNSEAWFFRGVSKYYLSDFYGAAGSD